MQRQCYKCGQDLTLEPAIKGFGGGLLCFPCRFWQDDEERKRGILLSNRFLQERERYRVEMERYMEDAQMLRIATAEYPQKCREYERQLAGYDSKWREYQQLGAFSKLLFKFRGASLPQEPIAPSPPLPLGGPPIEPTRDDWYRYSDLKVVFDGNPKADLDSKCVYLLREYPPDWKRRRARCLERDMYRCRLCDAEGSKDFPLLVHHVIPVPADGNHSLQNLLTVCEVCHAECHIHLRHLTMKALLFIWNPNCQGLLDWAQSN